MARISGQVIIIVLAVLISWVPVSVPRWQSLDFERVLRALPAYRR